MKSKSFSVAKHARFKTKRFKVELKDIKLKRRRTDRRATKQILRADYEKELPNKILLNNGAWEVV